MQKPNGYEANNNTNNNYEFPYEVKLREPGVPNSNNSSEKFKVKMPNGDIKNLNSFDEALFKAGAGQFRGAKLIKKKNKR